MTHHSFTLSFLVLALLSLVRGDNDWQTACITGTCSYESGDGVTVPWSTLLLNGASASLSDITPAAGWHILSPCEPDSPDPQTIDIVCVNQTLGCSHLFTEGAEDTIVRLPENCGQGPFARITSLTTSTNQCLPANSTVVPDGPIRTLSFDYDFSSITRKGGVSFTLAATTNPRQRTLLSASVLRRALLPVTGRRGLSNARATDLVSQFIELSRAPTAPKEKIAGGDSINLASIGGFSKEWSTDFHPLSLHQQFPLFDLKLTCPAGSIPGVPSGIDAHVSAGAQVDVDLSVSVGFIVTGSIIPLKINQLALTSGLTADAKAVVNLKADATGQLDQTIPLYTADIPGLNVPGILTLGPSFTINARVLGTLSTLADITVTTSWKAPKVELVFPPDQGDSGVEQQRGESSIDLAVGAQGTIKGNIEAHIIPKLEVGLSILSGIAKAGVFLELDPYAALDFDLTGSGTASTGGIAARGVETERSLPPRAHARDIQHRALPPAVVQVRDVALNERDEPHALEARAGSASGNISGCIGLDLGFKIRAGAQGSLKPFFDESVSWDLVDLKGDIFDKCFAASTPKRSPAAPAILGKRATEIACPTIPLELLHVIQQNIAAA